ncbi:MAG: HAD family hydrolase [Paenibacillus sp.]|nr:HAD family hydrolase [Paenibacillus sp.]
MKFKAIFLDFYGTLVHEDDDIIPVICEEIKSNTSVECSPREIGSHWWNEFSNIFRNSYGDSFKSQREIGLSSLTKTIKNFQSNSNAEELIKEQFKHWIQPRLYEDTKPFLEAFHGVPLYILSNIDSSDINNATAFHEIKVNEIITSEDVRSYKPRPELFLEALRRNKLNADEVIHIGDSITSDVVGAQNLGIRVIWLNRLNKRILVDIKPDFICKDLNEVTKLLSDETDYEKVCNKELNP